MNDEDVIKKRLLIDGDGTGEDRRINNLLKLFIKWCNSDETVEESNATKDQMLAILAQCKYSYAKSRIVARVSARELNNYEELTKKTKADVQDATKEIVGTKLEFQQAKVVRQNRLEYEVLTKAIKEQPDRKETDAKLAELQTQLSHLEEKREELQAMLELRRKQFYVLMASLHQLKSLLDDGDADAKSSTDISLELIEDDMEEVDLT